MLNTSNKMKKSMNNHIKNKSKEVVNKNKQLMKVIPSNDVSLPTLSNRELELERKHRMGNARYHKYRYFKSRNKTKADSQGKEVPYKSEIVGLSVKKQIGDLVKSMEKVNLKTDFIRGKKSLNSLLSHLERKIDRAHDHNIERDRIIKERKQNWSVSPPAKARRNQHKKLYSPQGSNDDENVILSEHILEKFPEEKLSTTELSFYERYGKSYFHKFISSCSDTAESTRKICYEVPYANIKRVVLKCAQLSIPD